MNSSSRRVRGLPQPLVLVSGFLLTCGLAQAAVSPEAARKVLTAHQDAVVLIEGVLKAEMVVNGTRAGEPRESRIDISGFIVDASGLVAVSTFHLNPMGILGDKPMRMERGGKTFEIETRTRIENLRLRLRDRSEVPARIVIQDRDLGLTLLGPDSRDGASLPKFHAVPLEEAAVPVASTQYLVVDRGAGTFRNEWILESGILSGVLTKPRTRFLQDLGRSWIFVGAPFFDLEGRLLGLGMMEVRLPENPGAGAWDSAPIPVIAPAADLRELVRRALDPDDSSGDQPKSMPARQASRDRLSELSPEGAEAVLAASGNAVVAIEGSVKYKCGRCAEDHEDEIAEIGTILDPTGLIVMAGDGYSADNRYLEQRLRCLLADGRQVPVQILLHDDDLLLTVLAPAAGLEGDPKPDFHALTARPETRAEILDNVLVLGRLGSENRYSLSAAIGHVVARVTQPRVFYQLYAAPPALSYFGLPVLTADGALLGITAPDPQGQDVDRTPNPFSQQATPPRIVPADALIELLDLARKTQAKADPATPPIEL
jgi:hypothetical protein